jgi:hypothetical protein
MKDKRLSTLDVAGSIRLPLLEISRRAVEAVWCPCIGVRTIACPKDAQTEAYLLVNGFSHTRG